MAANTQLTVSRRADVGKTKVRPMRREGMVPGIYYSSKGENIPVLVEENPLAKAYKSVGKAHVLSLTISGDGETVEAPVLIKQLDKHPYKNRILHVDFFGPDMDKTIVVAVPMVMRGKAAGTTEGGRVQLLREAIHIESLPANVPDAIEVDVSPLKIGQSILLSQITPPEGVALRYKQDSAVVTVLPPKGTSSKDIDGEESAVYGGEE